MAMAGQAQSREKLRALEAGLKRMGLSPAAVLEGKGGIRGLPGGRARAAAADGTEGDSTPDGEASSAQAHARYSADFRASTLAIAEDCARRLQMGPDRDVAQVYRSMIDILQRIEASDPKDPEPRPEDVRKGVVDTLQMLPELCAHDAELRTLAVDALAKLLDAAESAPSSAPTKD